MLHTRLRLRRRPKPRYPRPLLYLVEPCEPRRLLTAIASDQTLAGTIATSGQVDTYTFSATAGQSIYAAVAETVAASPLSVSVALRAPDNTLLDSASSATGTNVFVTNVTQTGTFTLTVTGLNNTTGAYAITLALPGTAPVAGTDAGPIPSAAYRTATIDPGDLDVHTIAGTAGGNLLVTVGETVTSGFDPEISVYSPSGGFLASSASATGTVILQSLATTGTYYVVVADQFNDETGSYGLTVATFGGTQITDADSGPMNSGERRTGTLDPGDFDVYTLSANAAGSLLAALGETTTSGFDPQLIVFSPTGAVLSNTAAAVGTDALLSNLAATGTYYVAVLDQFADETGAYALSLARFGGNQSTSNADEGGAMTSGEYRTGAVSPGDFDVYTLSASAGNTLVATLGDLDPVGGLDPQLIVFSPTGAVLNNTAGADGTSTLLTNLPATGTYAVVALDQFGDESGFYGLSAARFGAGALPPTVSPGDEGGTLTSAQRRLGRIAPGDLDAYSFDLAGGNGAFWTVGETIDSPFTPQLIILGPNGNVISNSPNARGRDAALPTAGAASTGTYTAIVLDFGGGTPGEYALTGVAVPAVQSAGDTDSGPLTAGQPRAGALPPGDADVYTVTATAGQALTFNLAETNPATTTLTPALIVYAPNGAIAGSNLGTTSTSVPISSALAGTYTVVVEDSGGDGTGAYSLALNTATGNDTAPPALLESAYRVNDRTPTVRLAFSEDVEASFQPEDFQLQDLTTNQPIDPADLSITFDAVTNEIYFGFNPLPGGLLPDGNYRLTIPAANLTDVAGNPLAAPISLDFFVLAGDANRDRVVNFDDLVILAKNYNRPGAAFGQGDFSYDGTVNFDDLLILAKNYNKTIPAPAPPLPTLVPATTALATPISMLRDDKTNHPIFSNTRIAPPAPAPARPKSVSRPKRR